MRRRNFSFTIVFALLGAPPAAMAQSSTTGDCSAMGSVGGNFSPNCHNIYIAPPSRNLASPSAQEFVQVLLNLPRDRIVSVASILGDSEAQSFAMQVQQFFQQNGFKVDPGSPSQVVFAKPLIGIEINNPTDTKQPIKIYIGQIPPPQ